ncbi:hypothetical protein PENSPDRAFT_757227 [Peniophora sp. CONT]|nr:hypothetical protein PENSPDRAFT_757227 [Peniophora sp. CONT]
MTHSTASVMSLKEDILFELFTLIAATDVPHPLPWVNPGPLKYYLGWVRLTHVCRLWRAILVDEMPGVWAAAVCRLPSAHSIMLARARNRPLTLNLNISLNENLCLPSGHIHHERLYKFAIVNLAQADAFHALYGIPDRNWVPVLEDQHLPLLKYLELKQKQSHGHDSRLAMLHSFDTPNLVWARLEDIAITFTSTTIRHLSVLGHVMFCTPEWSILDVLSRLPLLEWLSLDQKPPERADYSQYKGPAISLDRLETCRLYGNANANLAEFYSHLSLSPQVLSQMDELYFVHDTAEADGWENDFIATFGPSLNTPLFDSLIASDDGNVFVGTFPAMEKPELAPRQGRDRHVALELHHNGEGAALRIGLAVLALVERAHIKHLAFGFPIPDVHTNLALEALREFSAITSFTAMRRDVLKLLTAQEDGHIAFPKLEILHAVMELPLDETMLQEWWDRLVQVLDERSSAGAPIRRLRLADDWRQVEWNEDLSVVDAVGMERAKLLVPDIVDERSVPKLYGVNT